MKALLYDWLGLNEWMFQVLYRLNVPLLDNAWRILAYGYGYWIVAVIGLVISVRYLQLRHTASATAQLDSMADITAVLILSFSLVWCLIYTVQTVTLWPTPRMLYSNMILPPSPMLWHEGFPASAPAMSMMAATLFWRYTRGVARQALVAYVLVGCILCVVSGQNWPADAVYGLIVGFLGVRLAQVYYGFARRLVTP